MSSPNQLALKDGIVDIWIVDLQVHDQTLLHAHDILSQEELARAHRFRFPADSRRFVAARAALRQLLGKYLDSAPERLEFEYGEFGKPRLANADESVQFNASRSGETALIGCTVGRQIGVDIELMRRDVEIGDLARRFFTATENETLQEFPPDLRHSVFFRCWTCKEAFVKGVGKGLSLGLDQFDVSLGLGDPKGGEPRIEGFVVNGWWITPMVANSLKGYSSALATPGDRIEVRVQTWIETKA